MNNSKNTAVFRFSFPVIVICYFAGLALNNETLQMIFKPLLVAGLLFHLVAATKGSAAAIKKFAVAALIFSIAGDTLLMFSNKSELFFLAGLVAFLIAHVCYIICFHKIKIREKIEGRWPWAVVVGIYYYFIISFLMPNLAGMKIPVMVYGAVISFMLFTALLLYDMKDNKTARYLLSGALFFVISDSVLAINKFHHPFEMAGWAIMLTYVAAQFLLTKGLLRYISAPLES